jgi:hypothetical protein
MSDDDIETGLERSTRFGDWEELEGLCQSGKTVVATAGEARAPVMVEAFVGPQVKARMDMVRAKIAYIRQHWDRYDEFAANLETALSTASSPARAFSSNFRSAESATPRA